MDTLTISTAVDDYLETLRMMRRPRTLESATQILTEFKLAFSETPLTGLTRKDILAYLDGLKKTNSNRTLANKFVRICAMLRHHDIKVTRKGDRPQFEKADPEIYDNPADLARFFNACDGRQRVFFKTLLFAGLRMNEAKNLEWDDLNNGMLHVRSHGAFKVKTWEARQIPLSSELWKMLMGMPRRPGRLVFPTANGKPDRHMLRHCKRIARRAKLDEGSWWLHKFRATCCTTLLREGVDIRTVMKIMGHRNIQTTMRYLAPIEMERMRSKMDNVFAAYTA